MAAIKTRHTAPEILVQRILRRLGYRFKAHANDLPGNPDIALPRRKRAIFVHGCFWHGHIGCPRAARPTANAAFWKKKIEGNKRRDARVKRELKSKGWEVLEIWGCKTDPVTTSRRLQKFLCEGG